MYWIAEKARGSGRIAAFFLCLCLAGILEARPNTDSVVLDNGNLITGELKSLENGIIRFSTDAMGTVSIEWKL